MQPNQDSLQENNEQPLNDSVTPEPYSLSRPIRWGVLLLMVAVVTIAVELRLGKTAKELTRIETLLFTEHFPEAESLVVEFLDAHPGHTDAKLLLARVLRAKGEQFKATRILDELQSQDPSCGQYADELILIQARSGQIEEAEPHLARLLTESDLDPRDICETFVIGYRINYRLDEAAALLEAWQEDWPDDFRPFVHRGIMAQMVARWPLAIDEFLSALEHGDWRAGTHLKLGQCYLEVNDNQAAEQQFQACIEAEPKSIDGYLGLAKSLEKLSREDDAISAYQEAIGLDPNSFEARLGISQLKLNQGKAAEARHDLKQLLLEWPEDRKALYQYSQALSTLGENKEAKEVLEAWSNVDKEIQRMEKMVTQLKDHPQNVEQRTEIGILLLKHYSRSMGTQYLQSVLIHSPDHQLANATLADYYEKIGDKDLAQEHRKRLSQ